MKERELIVMLWSEQYIPMVWQWLSVQAQPNNLGTQAALSKKICETKHPVIFFNCSPDASLKKMWSLGRLGKQAVSICSTMGSNNTPVHGDVGKNDLSVISVSRRALWIQFVLLLMWDPNWKDSAGKNNSFQKKKVSLIGYDLENSNFYIIFYIKDWKNFYQIYHTL